MKLALSEVRRARGRFTSVVAALGLIVVLVLVLAALADGLFYGQTGVARSTDFDLQVQAADAEGALGFSRLPADLAAEIEAVDGVAAAGGVAVLQAAGEGPQGPVDLSVFGQEAGRPGAPLKVAEGRLPEPGETGTAAVDSLLAGEGVGVGDTVTVHGLDFEVVGVVDDVTYGLQPSLWAPLDTWQDLRADVLPETAGAPPTVAAVAVAVEEGADPAAVADRIDERLDTQTYTRDEAVVADPIVVQQNAVLRSVIIATFLVAGLVVALFFALLTLEKRGLFAVVKALGASTRYIAAGVALQALLACLAGFAVGGVATVLLAQLVPDAVPVLFRPQAAVTLVAAIVPTALLGAVLSFRRIARIDPATALGGAL